MGNYKEDKKYHFSYKTTNITNGKYYLGMHSTNNLDDGYLGSGKRLRYSIRKYGVDDFKLVILKHFDNFDDMRDAEIELITKDDIKNPNCMNLKEGGDGGWSIEQQRNGRIATDNILREKYGDDFGKVINQQWRSGLTDDDMDEYRKKVSDGVKLHKKNNPDWNVGEANPNYGTCWITNGEENRKAKKDDVFPNGWKRGRVNAQKKHTKKD
jgi:hypothetical protein